jgi:hypothetical protein
VTELHRSGPDLARAAHAVLEGGQLLDADRAARMHLAGGDADLGAHAEFAAIGELGRGVVQQDGAESTSLKNFSTTVSASSAITASV